MTDQKYDINYNYPQYFSEELKSFLKKENKTYDLFDEYENFEENRHKGENENYICQLIQEDRIEDFIIHIKKNDIDVTKSYVQQSIYETNNFILKAKPSFYSKIDLLEYASFFGSMQIVRYLHKNGVKPSKSLWLFAVHSNNPELIKYLEDNRIESDNLIDALNESIKCVYQGLVFQMFASNEIV